MMNTYLYLGGLLTAICLLAGGMFISAKVHYLVKVALAAFVVALSVYAWSVAVAVLGYPVNGYPQDGSIMLSVGIDKKQNAIYFWIREKDGPRAYKVPYSEGLGQQLAEAQAKAAASHGIMVFHSKKKGKGGQGNSQGGDGDGEGGDGVNGAASGQGKLGTKAKGYGAAPGFDDDSAIMVTIDVIPSIPAKD
jgi:hypothetical protein